MFSSDRYIRDYQIYNHKIINTMDYNTSQRTQHNNRIQIVENTRKQGR